MSFPFDRVTRIWTSFCSEFLCEGRAGGRRRGLGCWWWLCVVPLGSCEAILSSVLSFFLIMWSWSTDSFFVSSLSVQHCGLAYHHHWPDVHRGRRWSMQIILWRLFLNLIILAIDNLNIWMTAAMWDRFAVDWCINNPLLRLTSRPVIVVSYLI